MKALCQLFSFFLIIITIGCSKGEISSEVKTSTESQEKESVAIEKQDGTIYLFGESHGDPIQISKQLELWKSFYEQGMRHLFLESPYYTGEFLNLWMKEKDDHILDALYADWSGTARHNPYNLEFFKKVKELCPETVFHGTDVGHQYSTIGIRYRDYLEATNQKDTQHYFLTNEAIDQGLFYYRGENDFYRENMMTMNFVREFEQLQGEAIMGIYGAAHTGLDALDFTNSVPCMANQLVSRYGYSVKEINLVDKPVRIDNLEVNGKEYTASYYGTMSLKGLQDFDYREFWRLESAYRDFKVFKKTGDVLPFNNYPMKVETGQVFIIDYYFIDGRKTRTYYIADGRTFDGMPTTEEVKPVK